MCGDLVALGGTFDPIHDGHRALLDCAFSRGDVTIGMTSDDLARRARPDGRDIRPYGERLRALAIELDTYVERYGRTFEIRKLHEPTGIADAPQFEVLVVSPETEPAGHAINDIRDARGLDPLEIVVVDHVLAEDGEIISSTRILAGEIDEHGNVLD